MEWFFMPLKRYAEFSGRSRRQEFWMWQLAKFLASMVLGVVAAVVLGGSAMALIGSGTDTADGGVFAALGIGIILLYLLAMVLSLAIIVPDLAVTVRRLHDSGRTGKWLLAPIAPIALGVVISVIGAALQSTALALIGGLVVLLAFVGVIVLLVFMFIPGTIGPNRYGPDPKAAEHAMRGGVTGL